MGMRHLAIDIGASSGRHIVGEVVGGHLELTEVYRFENGVAERNGHLCWDIEHLFDEVVAGMRACAARGLVPNTMGIDTWAVDFVLLDAQGARLGDAIAYRDGRTEGIRERLESAGVLSFAEQYERTGIQYQAFNTAYQLAALQQESPEVIDAASTLLLIPDYLQYRLTGTKVCEYTNASTTALVNAKTCTWDDELIARLGLNRGLFPKIVQPGTVLGALLPEVAKQVGFSCEVVVPATHDTGSAWLAVPAPDDRSVFLSSGTWSLIGVERCTPLLTEASRVRNFTNEGGAYGTYRYLKNIMGLWMAQCVRRELMERDGNAPSFGELAELAARVPGQPSIVAVNDDRFLAPASMIDEVRSACRETGQRIPTTTPELMQCIYCSLAHAYADAVHELEQLTGTVFERINIVGGGCQNAYLNRMTAMACGIPVYAGPVEGTALGNIMVQLIASGEVADLAAARALVRKSFDIREVQSR